LIFKVLYAKAVPYIRPVITSPLACGRLCCWGFYASWWTSALAPD